MQTFNIEVEGMQVTKELVRGLLRQYFNTMQYGGNIVVEDAAQQSAQRTAETDDEMEAHLEEIHGMGERELDRHYSRR